MEATVRDRKAPSVSHQNVRALGYQVGSVLHPCTCGSYSVFRAHEPGQAGWTLYCWDCSRKDEATGFKMKRKVHKPFLGSHLR
jgi:hypothetical protein